MFCLRQIGLGASNTLPQLRRNYLAETKPNERLYIAFTALAIEPPGGWGEAEVRTMLAVGGDEGLCRNALDWLKPQTNAMPRFEQELAALARTGKKDLAWPALDALVKADLGSARTSPVLTDCLFSTNLEVRVSAAGWLLEFQPTNSLAFEVVTNAFTDDKFGDGTGHITRYWLMTCLAKLGPAAAPALPLIRKYYLAAPYARDRIAKAIRTIEGKP
jgi:hypothetical protein